MRRRWWVGAGVALLALVAIVGIFVLTMTDYGRERVRLFSVGELQERINGEVEIGEVRGNLLSGATLVDVSIRDPQGNLFLRADTLQLKYSMRSLFQKHLVFTDVRLVRPVVIFDQPPGGEWNVTRIFRGDTTVVPGDTIPGFGDWVRIEDLAVVEGEVTVRREWKPDEADPQRETEDVIAPDQRELIVEVPGGYQSVSTFHRLTGGFPLLRLADPDSAARVVDVDSLSMIAFPFKPPGVRVRDLEGRLTITGSTIGFHDLNVRLPDSELLLEGVYGFSGPELVNVQIKGEPVSLPDLRFLRPALPEGTGEIDLTIARSPEQTLLVARNVDLRVGGGRLRGFAEIETSGGRTRLDRSDLRFDDLDTRTIERLAGVDVPVEGVLDGRVRLAGTADELDVDGDATIRERSGAVSRVRAEGTVVNRPDGLVARGLRLRFDPLNLTLVRSLEPDVPLRGSLTGRAMLNGPLDRMFAVDADLVHNSPTAGRSRIAAEGGLQVRGGVRARGLDLVLDPVQAELVRVLDPDFPLGGTIRGRASLDGSLASLFSVDADLVHDDPVLGRSSIEAEGGLRVVGGLRARNLRVRGDPIRTALIRVVAPEFPVQGTIAGTATVDGDLRGLFSVDADLVHRSPAGARSDIEGVGGLRLSNGFAARDLRLRVEPLQPGLIRVFDPDFPLEGTITGRATLDGDLEAMFAMDADLVHESPETGRSHIVGEGSLRLAGGVAARDLRVRMDPLRAELVRAFGPDLRLDGSLEGSAVIQRVDGDELVADVDITHRGSSGTSALEGDVAVTFPDGIRTFDVDLRVAPLSLATVRRFAPRSGLHGSVTGSIVASGTSEHATVDADVQVEGGGALDVRGTFGLGPGASYDLRGRLTRFDASAVTTRAPATGLTGFVDIEGVGTRLATANADIRAVLADSELEGTPRMDSTRVDARLEAGLIHVREGQIRLASARADLEGSFGLVAGRQGELRYTVTVDSLSRFADVLPADTGVVVPRPLPRAVDVADARADSARVADQDLVESMATGRPPPPSPALDTLPPLPRDSVAGTIHAEGVLVGNVERFDTRGRADLQDVVYRGTTVGSGTVDYEVFGAPDPADLRAELTADLEEVRVAGFAFAGADLRLDHGGGVREGEGRLELDLIQDDARDYQLTAEYELALDRSEVRVEEMALRFGATQWTSTGPGVVRWAGSGVELEDIELVNEEGGRIFADGRLPDGAPGDLRLEIDSLQLANVMALVQDTVDTRGLVSLDARVTGSLRAPVITGTFAVDSLVRAGEDIPDVEATFEYADRELVARTRVAGEERTLLEGEVRLGVDLALSGREGPLFLDAPVTADLQLDSLPLTALPVPGDQVTGLRGRLAGELRVRGTLDAPDLQGDLRLEGASAHLTEAGITLREGFGHFRLRGRTIEVDSLVATSGGNPVRVAGTVSVEESLLRPELDLELTATDAVVLSREDDRVRADLDLDLVGPLRDLRVEGDARVTEGEIWIPDPEHYRQLTRLDDPVLAHVLDTLDVPAELRPRNPLLEHVRADVRVRIERDTWLRNQDLHVEIYTPRAQPPLRLRTHPETRSFSILGVVHVDRGDYTFAGRQLELNSGSVTFLGEEDPDPLIQLNAQHEVPRRGRETLVVLINVGGYLSAPTLALSSNHEPPLPESDLLAYLAFGQSSGSVLGSEGSGIIGEALGGLGVLAEQQLAGLGLGALTDAALSKLEERGTGLGIDLFRVRPDAAPDELNYSDYFQNFLKGTEIEAGEYLGKRFFIKARARPAEELLPGLEFEYRTPAGFTWLTTWDRRFLPRRPELGSREISRSRAFGSFLVWTWRY